jgi:dihydropyrimidinase
VIWQGLQTGVFQIFSSDHAPYRFDDKGKFAHGRNVGFNRISNGVPGVETRLPLLFSEGYLKDRIDLNQFVALSSTNAAKLYGLYPRKGTVAVGSDADLAIWDSEYEVTIGNHLLHHDVDYTPYEGRRIRGWPAVTLCRGEVIAEYHDYKGRRGFGQFLPCAKSPMARPRGQLPRELTSAVLGRPLF